MRWLIEICCCVLVFSDVAGLSIGEPSFEQKYVYIGEAAKLFSIDSHYKDPALYSETETHIASWNGTTITVEYMNPNYSGKIFMDNNRSIWILNLERKDGGKYSVKFFVKLERHDDDIILTVKDKKEQPQDGRDCPTEGNLIGEKIGEIRKLLVDQTGHIREYLGRSDVIIYALLIFDIAILVILIVTLVVPMCKKPKQSPRSLVYRAVSSQESGSLYFIFGLSITAVIVMIIAIITLVIAIIIKVLNCSPNNS